MQVQTPTQIYTSLEITIGLIVGLMARKYDVHSFLIALLRGILN